MKTKYIVYTYTQRKIKIWKDINSIIYVLMYYVPMYIYILYVTIGYS